MAPRRRVRVRNRAAGGLWWRIPIALCAGALVAAPQVAAVAAYELYAHYARDLPSVPDLDAYARAAPRTSVIVAADGTVLAELPFTIGGEAGHRIWLPYEALPARLVQAILAAEDVRFFEHAGVDARAVARAAWANYRAGHTVEGASTITQQVARNLLPLDIGRERSFRRKAREMILARRIERRWDKRRIFETWANHVFLGAGAYGVAAAARSYFAKPVAELDLAECALIAGLAQAPGRADPYRDLAAARARRDEVLDRMLRAGFVTAEEHAAARAAPIALTPPRNPYGSDVPWMTEAARREIAAVYPAAYARGGLVVHTTALPVAATAAEEAARAGSAKLAKRQRSQPPQVGAYAFDHVTGYVLAVAGGLDWGASQFDRATQACRQPGSAFKPVVYAAALERDVITPGTALRDAPVAEYDEDRDVFWKPQNRGHAFRGVAIAQDALAASLNAPAVDVLDRVGARAAIELAQRLGLTTPIDAVRPLVLGSSCVVPAELARAFGAFAAGGFLPAPIVVTRVVARGEPLVDRASPYDPFVAPGRRLDLVVEDLARRASAAPALDAQTAFLMSSMLVEVVRAGTGRDARALGRPAAGKTGTTNGNTDAWFVGYTGRVAAAVWIGHDDPARALGPREDGAHAALPIWIAILRILEEGRPAAPVLPDPRPDGIVTARIDRMTGLLARSGAGGAVDVYFREGTEPTEEVDAVRGIPRDLDQVSRDF